MDPSNYFLYTKDSNLFDEALIIKSKVIANGDSNFIFLSILKLKGLWAGMLSHRIYADQIKSIEPKILFKNNKALCHLDQKGVGR